MAKPVSTLIGLILLVVGVVGFIPNTHNLLGAHLSPAHNAVHIVSGLLALYFGIKGTPGQAKAFALIFGIVYAALGVVGYLMGKPGEVTLASMRGQSDEHLFPVIKGTLELGTTDHYIHIAVGVLFLIAAIATRISSAPRTQTA
ncbi:MAG TPA: DUF4383 domain-containing protein [Blastocatellia bacterium]|jgi:hypothetical protein|nr:DUF4383 domain-containing protein [Blastocatellia bacterium]